ncbi:hypothetical protein RRF57_012192 [Xylaria bambusicola]|uniref:Uncharacterized protein n=1 Tax=Xylaria bambusicola TaxID=326684 RepID=A0AAN7UP54_9PEZI
MSGSNLSAGPTITVSLMSPSSNLATHYIELDFVPNEQNLIQARDDPTLYWSSSHQEVSDSDLFIRAAKTRTRLIPDLKNTLIKLSNSRKRWIANKGKLIYDIEPPERRYELRLTGKVNEKNTTRILMTGWVWIQCSDLYSAGKIKKRLDELQWLQTPAYAPVHIYHEPIVAANTASGPNTNLYDHRTGVDFGNGCQLHVDIAPGGISLCGRPCRLRVTRASRVVYESFCRVGGVLHLDHSVDVLATTAHGILNYFLFESLPSLESVGFAEDKPENSTEISDFSSEESDLEESPSQEQQNSTDSDTLETDKLGHVDTSQLQHWLPIDPFDTITYIAQARQAITNGDWNLYFGTFNTDYALFKQREQIRDLRPNKYYVPSSTDYTIVSRTMSTAHVQTSPPGGVKATYLLLGPCQAVPVELCPEVITTSIFGARFKAIKLRAPKVLG